MGYNCTTDNKTQHHKNKESMRIMLAENKDKKISVRVSESDYRYLAAVAYMAGMTVSKYIRTLCDASINAVKLSEKQGKVNIEDIQTLLDD